MILQPGLSYALFSSACNRRMAFAASWGPSMGAVLPQAAPFRERQIGERLTALVRSALISTSNEVAPTCKRAWRASIHAALEARARAIGAVLSAVA
jgi:hypothetical protein